MLLTTIKEDTQDIIMLLILFFSIIIRSSPEILLSTKQNFKSTSFFLTGMDLSETSRLIIVTLITLFSLLGLWKITIKKNQTSILEIHQHLTGLIQIFLCMNGIKFSQNQNQTFVCFYSANLIISIFIIIIKPLFLKIKSASFKHILQIRPYYQILNGIYFVVIAGFPIALKENIEIKLGLIFALAILKAYVFSLKIHYQNWRVEYCMILSQFGQWCSLISVVLTIYFQVNCIMFIWTYFVFLTFLFWTKNSIIMNLVQQKIYSRISSLKKKPEKVKKSSFN